jgi:hypothetical protein
MKFGAFDHIDRGLVPLDRFFVQRLSLVEAYDRAGFWLTRRGIPRRTARGGSLSVRDFPRQTIDDVDESIALPLRLRRYHRRVRKPFEA